MEIRPAIDGRKEKVMKSEELRAMQAPLKARYKEDAGAARVTLKAQGQLGQAITCQLATGKGLAEAGLHPASGGERLAGWSGVRLLACLVAGAARALGARA